MQDNSNDIQTWNPSSSITKGLRTCKDSDQQYKNERRLVLDLDSKLMKTATAWFTSSSRWAVGKESKRDMCDFMLCEDVDLNGVLYTRMGSW